MKYLYPYECEKRGLSSPGELQAAIDSNRREGRRQSYSSTIFNYSPVGTPTLLSSPKIQMSHLSMPAHNSGHISEVPVIKKGNVRQQMYETQHVKIWPSWFCNSQHSPMFNCHPPESCHTHKCATVFYLLSWLINCFCWSSLAEG